MDSHNFVQENLCQNGFSGSRRISNLQCELNPTSRPTVKPTLNRLHFTTDNPRSNPLNVECLVEPTFPVQSFCWPRSVIFINMYYHVLSVYLRAKCATIRAHWELKWCGSSLHWREITFKLCHLTSRPSVETTSILI